MRRKRKYYWPATAMQSHKAEEYEWIRPRKNWMGASRPVYLDFGESCHHLFRLKTIDAASHKTIAKTLRIRKKDFLEMCYGIPARLPPLLPDRSSFDFYGEAMNRRTELIAAKKSRELEMLSDLPLFAVNAA
jgi:hypothetical protein